MQNGLVENFNGRLRDGCLSEHLFASLAEARRVIAEWRHGSNTSRDRAAVSIPATLGLELAVQLGAFGTSTWR